MQKDGAIVKFEQKPMVIEQFAELIQELKNMIAAQNERAVADQARSQTQLEVLATLQAIIKQNASKADNVRPPDLTPFHALLAEIQSSRRHEPVDYDFKILRTGPGLAPAHTIEARVVRPTLN